MPTAALPAQAHSHPNVGGPAGDKPILYNPRHPERTLLYQTIAEHFETWHELAAQGCGDGYGGICSSDACSACANQGAPDVVPQPAQPELVPSKRVPSHYL